MHAIICHGTMGSPAGNWFPWLSAQLIESGIPNYVPTFPSPQNHSLRSWLDAFDQQCPPIDQQTILIGHSLGAVLCMRILEKLPHPVKATALISPPLGEIGIPEIDTLNSSFLDHPFNWSAIRANAGELSYFMGDDDQYVPQEQLLTIARELEVQPMVIPGAGHLNSETGYTRFPELLAELRRITT